MVTQKLQPRLFLQILS